jgi:hypothetical protein
VSGRDAGAHRSAQFSLCVPAFPARYRFNCTFTARHPETGGANRSEPERAGACALISGFRAPSRAEGDTVT